MYAILKYFWGEAFFHWPVVWWLCDDGSLDFSQTTSNFKVDYSQTSTLCTVQCNCQRYQGTMFGGREFSLASCTEFILFQRLIIGNLSINPFKKSKVFTAVNNLLDKDGFIFEGSCLMFISYDQVTCFIWGWSRSWNLERNYLQEIFFSFVTGM